MLKEKRVRLPATTVSVSVEPAADGAATVVIRFTDDRAEAPHRTRQPVLRLLQGGLLAAGRRKEAHSVAFHEGEKMSTKPHRNIRDTIGRVVLPAEIFSDPSSANAIALTRPEAPPDKPGERFCDPVPIDLDEYLGKLMA